MSINDETLLSQFDCYILGNSQRKQCRKTSILNLICKQIPAVKTCMSNMAVHAGLGRIPLSYTCIYQYIGVRSLLAIIVIL